MTWVKRIIGLLVALAICYGLLLLVPAKAEPVALQTLADAAPGAAAPAEPEPEPAAPAPEGEAAPAPEAPPAEGEPVPIVALQNRSLIEMYPGNVEPTAGLIFYGGGLIDPRAYAHILKPIVEAGYLVVVVKAPFDLPITDIGAVDGIVADHPGVTQWVVGGHSLGGVAASTFAAGNPRVTPNLLLWASYPYSDLADVDEVRVLSVSGSNDGLTSPADVEASKAKLPEGTEFVVIEGAVHSYFGDYGEQPGDGTPTISKEEAQQQIVAATLQWLNTVTAVS